MPDIINLLPDNIANQIAAGEVIQRPASAVKELLENAVDAGATEVKLIINDAGKQLIQVIDNGKGMSETDARMAFERHATSKIKNINDLFNIKTMGFRGEALASIAAVAQVELKTKKPEDQLGTYIEIENSEVLKQEPCAAPNGTSISMKNLFFNVPARRNFLKSNAVEMKHVVEEFIRVSMAFPNLFFSLTSNGQQVFYLEPGNLKQRVIAILGAYYNSKLVQVQEETDYLIISGFVGKPETAKKTRGDQYFFVNNRFIKSPYLHHAVTTAFDSLLPKDSFASYVLFIELNPERVDVNVHPTKQEIKFEDERLVYAFVQSAVKHALAQFSIAPSLDFTLNADIQQLDAINKPFTTETKEALSNTNIYKTFTQQHQAHAIEPSQQKAEIKEWKSFYQTALEQSEQPITTAPNTFYFNATKLDNEQPFLAIQQLHNTYILAIKGKDILLLHQQLAHERVLYEKYVNNSNSQKPVTQKSLFPATIELSVADAVLMEDLLPEFVAIGFEIEHFGGNSFIIQGTPADVLHGNEKHSIDLLLEQYKYFNSDFKFSKREKLIRCLAKQHAIKEGTSLTHKEMQALVDALFACTITNATANGLPTFIEFKEEYLGKLFGR